MTNIKQRSFIRKGMPQKNNAITYVKALAIILMVLGHAQCSIPFAWEYLTMFHIPMFFFVSGYCLKPRYLDAPRDFFMGKVRRLYMPFVKWVVIFLLLQDVFLWLHFYDQSCVQPLTWTGLLRNLNLTFLQMRGVPALLGGYWFLNALFFGSILAWLLLRYVRRPEYSLAAAFAILIVVHLTGFHVVFLNLNTRAFAAAFFVVAGYCFAQRSVKPFGLLPIVLSNLLGFVGIFFWLERIDQTSYQGYRIIPFVITAVLLSWSYYSVLVHWTETKSALSRLFRFIGEHTLTILTWHLVYFKLVSWAILVTYGLPVGRLAQIPTISEYSVKGWWVVYGVVSITLCCLTAYVGQKLQDFVNTQKHHLQ